MTGIVAPSNVGAASMPNYSSLWSQAIYPISGGKTFAGPADDPFFLDLRVFDLLYGASGPPTTTSTQISSAAPALPR